jgi:hypothetical protein
LRDILRGRDAYSRIKNQCQEREHLEQK